MTQTKLQLKVTEYLINEVTTNIIKNLAKKSTINTSILNKKIYDAFNDNELDSIMKTIMSDISVLNDKEVMKYLNDSELTRKVSNYIVKRIVHSGESIYYSQVKSSKSTKSSLLTGLSPKIIKYIFSFGHNSFLLMFLQNRYLYDIFLTSNIKTMVLESYVTDITCCKLIFFTLYYENIENIIFLDGVSLDKKLISNKLSFHKMFDKCVYMKTYDNLHVISKPDMDTYVPFKGLKTSYTILLNYRNDKLYDKKPIFMDYSNSLEMIQFPNVNNESISNIYLADNFNLFFNTICFDQITKIKLINYHEIDLHSYLKPFTNLEFIEIYVAYFDFITIVYFSKFIRLKKLHIECERISKKYNYILSNNKNCRNRLLLEFFLTYKVFTKQFIENLIINIDKNIIFSLEPHTDFSDLYFV